MAHNHIQPELEYTRPIDIEAQPAYSTDKAAPAIGPATGGIAVQRHDSDGSEKGEKKAENVYVDGDSAELEKRAAAQAAAIEEASGRFSFGDFYRKFAIFFDIFLVALITGWWISGLLLRRNKWIPNTVWAVFFVGLFFFKYVPTSYFSKPIGKAWTAGVSKPFFKLPYKARLGLGWLSLLALVFGSAYGFKPSATSSYKSRTQAVFGLFVFDAGVWLCSKHRSGVNWQPVLVGLAMQQVLAMFVLKSGAGFSLFKWISTAATDLLEQSAAGAGFFWSTALLDMHYFFINTLAAIIFFIALVQLLYYLGVMVWVLRKFAWFFHRTMGVSGAEAVVASSSPFIGQGESACLVKPFVQYMTPAEIHQTMCSGFSTVAGSVFLAYVSIGINPVTIITSSVMSIPASIAISKLRFPEVGEPSLNKRAVTAGRIVIARDEDDATNALHAFSNGAWFGLKVAGLVLANVLTVLSLLALVNGLLTYIGKSFHIDNLTLQLILGYVLYPVAWLLGATGDDILAISRIIGTKVIANEFVAFIDLAALYKAGGISERGFTICSYAVCGFGNISSLGIQMGVLSGLAPAQKSVIAKVGASALLCGILTTLQTAAVAGMLL